MTTNNLVERLNNYLVARVSWPSSQGEPTYIRLMREATARLALAEEVVKAARALVDDGPSEGDSPARQVRRAMVLTDNLNGCLAAYDASAEKP